LSIFFTLETMKWICFYSELSIFRNPANAYDFLRPDFTIIGKSMILPGRSNPKVFYISMFKFYS